jgi:mono/diheme cytochrome c family protein
MIVRGWRPLLCAAALGVVPAAAVLAAEAPKPASAGDPAKLPAAAARPVDFVRDIRPLFQAKCFACHGPDKQQGGLRLHRRALAMAGGDGGPVLAAGRSAESRLVHYVAGLVDGKRMPPAGAPLTAEQIGLIRGWIDQGAAWPQSADLPDPPSRHWAFRPVRRPALPAVKDRSWPINPIDAFILARLEAKGLRPSPPAEPVTLIRRLSLDLTGLPPTPDDVAAFVREYEAERAERTTAPPHHRTTGAYERLVDRLLDSPHYGERWGRHWLDLARYADSNGYTIDGARQMWMYREWVINALNRDLPFDRFTIEQLAGDLLPEATKDQIIATGFHRNTLINEEGGTDQEQFRVEAVNDRVATTGSVWLGLTVGCAQCHSHKYDPISQREYYQLFAFFNNQDEPVVPYPTPEQAEEQRDVRRQVAAARKELEAYDKAHPEAEKAKDPAREKLAARVKELTDRERELGRRIPTAMVLRERKEPRVTAMHIRGDFLRRGAPVEPGVPSCLPPLDGEPKSLTRLDLARWLVDPANPLTARVTVNRVWQRYFGRGLVETENDFGTQGTPPSHPELLDWLAAAFSSPATVTAVDRGTEGQRDRGKDPGSSSLHPSVSPSLRRHGNAELGWSLKSLHRLIVTSAAYRQSSRFREDLRKADPQNVLLGRQNRLRLEAEVIRDSALAASGLLSRKIGGPSVFPPQPAGTDLFSQVKKNWKASEGEDRYRRGLYTFLWRSNPYPLFTAFDAPDGNVACTRRPRSNTPLQSLMLANDESFVEMAQGLAAEAMSREGLSDEQRMLYAFRRCLARGPSPAELRRLTDFYRTQVLRFQAAPKDAEAAAPARRPEGWDAPRAAAWTALARVLLNLDEFVTRE